MPPDRAAHQPATTLAAAGLLASAALVSGCTAPLPPPPRDPPLLRSIDAHAGLSFGGAVAHQVYMVPDLNIDVPIGEATVAWLRPGLVALFARTTTLPDWPPWREGTQGLDGIVELEGIEMSVRMGNDAGTNPDVVSVSYRVCLYAPPARLLKCASSAWTNRHQRKPFECFPDLRSCISAQVADASRAAIARMLTSLENDPQVRAWERSGQAGTQP
jgi:hypothetical protein